MAQEVAVVVTDLWREKMARIHAGDTSLGSCPLPAYFKIGEGGWTDPGGGREPVEPDPSLTDITAGTGSYTNPDDYYFQKTITGADLFFVSPTRLEIRCIVNTNEANSDNASNPPEFYELGIFDSDDNMLVYSTFPVEIKTSSRSLQHVIYVDF